MYRGNRVIVVMPAFNAAKTLIPTYREVMEQGIVDRIILVDDASRDETSAIALTIAENFLLWEKLSEYHTGYRAFSRAVLETLPLDENSDGFVFDNQMLAQILWFGFRVCEVGCPTSYFAEASSVNFGTGIPYGLGCLRTGLEYRLARWAVLPSRRFPTKPPTSTAKSAVP